MYLLAKMINSIGPLLNLVKKSPLLIMSPGELMILLPGLSLMLILLSIIEILNKKPKLLVMILSSLMAVMLKFLSISNSKKLVWDPNLDKPQFGV
jgi:hypothetical protein